LKSRFCGVYDAVACYSYGHGLPGCRIVLRRNLQSENGDDHIAAYLLGTNHPADLFLYNIQRSSFLTTLAY
jgi:hypothetical protein